MNFSFLRGREPFNGWSHLIATLFSIFGAVILIQHSTQQGAILHAKIFYLATLICAYGSSALYHLAITTHERLRILRNIDHTCILALMIGTYVPLSVAMFPNHWNLILSGSFLVLFVAGMRLSREKNRRVLSISYIILASLPALAVPILWEDHWRMILWFSLGSCFYSIGAFCYIRKYPKKNRYLKFHEIWHIFVILGSLVHFLVIYHLP
jgi:hemolysin III